MVNKRKFIISDDLFSGFEADIDLDLVDSLADIINIINNIFLTILKNNKLYNLIEIFETKKFHIHDQIFTDILISEPGEIFYVCSHC